MFLVICNKDDNNHTNNPKDNQEDDQENNTKTITKLTMKTTTEPFLCYYFVVVLLFMVAHLEWLSGLPYAK